jgi:hypothetical protein
MSLRAQVAKQSPIKQLGPVEQFFPINGRLLRRSPSASLRVTPRNDMVRRMVE